MRAKNPYAVAVQVEAREPSIQHANSRTKSTKEFFSVAGGAAAAHAAGGLWHHPWFENTRKVVHKAAEDHHIRLLRLRKKQLEEELQQIREQLRRIV